MKRNKKKQSYLIFLEVPAILVNLKKKCYTVKKIFWSDQLKNVRIFYKFVNETCRVKNHEVKNLSKYVHNVHCT